ncbi:MAG: alpha/beta hydrolase [Parvibaculum sp.]|uniref:alpha/beta hydrolase n=1 Tax=Parvibaculum sp. TaxID=2024848 RepID=UPI00271C38A4|nr:alpha/beta hydrolase [Parvibaculum sp.]MDO8838851.1 alpha/beta hydrolase [Parvibaculum sp.]
MRISDHQQPIERAAGTVMLIHGMWSRPQVWQGFREFLEARGYRVLTPALRHHDREPGDAPHPELGQTSLADYVADLAAEIATLGHKPLAVGHSMGGTLAQMLAARGLVEAAVALAPAQCAGTFNFDLRSIWIFRREFARYGFWQKPQLPAFDAMRFGVLNGLPGDEQERLYATLVPESGRAAFEIGWWFLDRQRTTWINPADVACPMLFLTGDRDKLTPLWLARRTAAIYDGKARFEELGGHAHWLISEPGWEAVAERCADYFEREAGAHATAIRERHAPFRAPSVLAPAGN